MKGRSALHTRMAPLQRLLFLLLGLLLVSMFHPARLASASRCELDPTRCENPVTVIIDGRKLSGAASAFIEDGRVLIPLRALSEALGATVEWDSRTQTATAYFGSGVHITTVQIGSRVAKTDYWPFLLDVPARMVNDRTYVPLRFMVEALGASVAWDNATRTATVISHAQPAPLYSEVLEAAVKQLARHMERCKLTTSTGEIQHALCIDPEKYTIEMSPALFRQVKWYMDSANLVAQIPDFKPQPATSDSDAQRLLRNVAVPEWNPSPGYQPSVRLSPSPSLLAVLLGSLGLLGGDTSQEQKIMDLAQHMQENTGYQADSYKPCLLKAGTIIYGGLPGQSNFYTNAETLEASGRDAVRLWQSLQVPPSKEHMSYRPFLGRYRLKIDVTAACGKTAANSVVQLGDGTRIYAGEGGGFQYFLSDYGPTTLALEGELVQLENWVVTEEAWATLVR